ncbi:MAG TPA: hypothetical protein VKB47_13755 [Terracidiphilus sp.]|nr:hypothetical protein [Terracidiphilus sp.]
MRFAGLLVMPAGFFLSIAAILLFSGSAQRAAFVLCGLAVEAMGLVVAIRGHMQLIRNPQRQDFDPGISGSANQ